MLSQGIESRLDRKDYAVEVVKFGAPSKLYKKVWRNLTRQQALDRVREAKGNILTLSATVYGKVRENDKVLTRKATFRFNDSMRGHAEFWQAHGPLTADELKGWLPIYADRYIIESMGSAPKRDVIDKLVGYYEMWHMTNPMEIAKLIRHRYPRWPLRTIYRMITGKDIDE